MEQPDLDTPIFSGLEFSELLIAHSHADHASIMLSLRQSARQLLDIFEATRPWAAGTFQYLNCFCRDGSPERAQFLLQTIPKIFGEMRCIETGQLFSEMDGRFIDNLHFDNSHLAADEPRLTAEFVFTGNLRSLDIAILRTALALPNSPQNESRAVLLEISLLTMHSMRYQALNHSLDMDWTFWHLGRAISFYQDGTGNVSNHMFLLAMSLAKGRDAYKQAGRFDLVTSFLKQVFLLQTNITRKAVLLDSIAELYCDKLHAIGESVELNRSIILLHEQAGMISSDGRTNNPEWISHLGWHYRRQFDYCGDLSDADRAIEYLSRGKDMAGDDHPVKSTILHWLCKTLLRRFEHLGKISDLDEALVYQLHGISLPDLSTDGRGECLLALGNSYSLRYQHLKELSDLECALKYRLEHVHLTPDSPAAHTNLGKSYSDRYDRHAMPKDLDNAIESLLQALSSSGVDHDLSTTLELTALAYHRRFRYSNGAEDLETAMRYQSQAVELWPDGPTALRAKLISNLGSLYIARHGSLGNTKDIDEAVCLYSQAVTLTQPGHSQRCNSFSNLGTALSHRYHSLCHNVDLEQAIDSYRAASLASESPSNSRFDAAYQWARLCTNHKSASNALPAYRTAMSLLSQVAWLGGSTSWRYNIISAKQLVVIKASAAAIEAKSYALALEWLEQGRSIVWKQLLQLRTPLEELREVNPALASRFEAASTVLAHPDILGHTLTGEESTLGISEEQFAQRRRRVAQEWEELLEEVRQLPEFDNFLQPAKIDWLVKSASSSTVVVLFVHHSGGSALVIRKGVQLVEHISLPQFNLDKANLVSGKIKQSSNSFLARGPDRKITSAPKQAEAQHRFQSALTTLWFDVVEPVLTRLGHTSKVQAEELPRITWCCTGPLSSLPLHAAGDYATAGSGARVFDFIISSYTPTLTSLIPRSGPTAPFTGILAVSQSHTLGQIALPGATEELERIETLAKGLPLALIRDEEATDDTVITAMARHSWVHLACHASQSLNEPQSSAFHLHGSALSLRRISAEQIKVADFAFLSACQTATGDESVPDEAVHLAAGMLMTGYKTVIATMWSIRDEDAPFVAEHVYSHLLKDGVPNAKRASVALHDAVGKLRERVGEENFAAWVPYIHIGQ